MNREVEVKLALEDPADLERLLAALGEPVEVVEQANHYYTDPDGLLSRSLVTVRLREEHSSRGGSTHVVTVKRRTDKCGAVFSSDEHEAELDAETFRAIECGALALEQLDVPPLALLRAAIPGLGGLHRVGVLANRRHRVPWRGWLLEVDRTEFADASVDLEIEVETPEPEAALDALSDFLRSQGFRWRPQTTGKYTRFRARLPSAR